VKNSWKTALLWIFLLVGLMVFLSLLSTQNRKVEPLEFNDYVTRFSQPLENDDKGIEEVKITGMFKHQGTLKNGDRFETQGELTDDLLEKLLASGAKVSFEKDDENVWWQQLLITWLPLGVLVIFFIMFMRQLQAGSGKASQFGKSKARLINDTKNKVTFKDVAGVEEAKEELTEIVEFLKSPKKFTKLGGRIPKGVLLMGPPGTGKTLMAKAVAGEAGVPFFSISGSDFVEMFVGVGASRVRDLFEQGKKNAPCLIFIDEIDAVGRQRGAGLGGGHDEREQTLNQLLVEMDGFETTEGVILIAASNRPDVLDPALMRPGRFDRRIIVPRPDVRGRHKILKVHTRKVPMDPDVELDIIARGTPGFSGADLANLVNEAALIAASSDKEKVFMADFDAAKDKIMMGKARRSMIIHEDEKRNTAFHETGHALIAKFLEGTDPVYKVSIIPRGTALGVTQSLPTEDRYTMTKRQARNTITMLMGGRAAEEIAFGKDNITTGAGNDIERATELARKMVCEWGMSEKLGPLSFGTKEEHLFLGREVSRHQDYGAEVASQIDAEVHDIVSTSYATAVDLLAKHRPVLDRISEELLEQETMDGRSLDEIIRDMTPESLKSPTPLPPKEKLDDDEGDTDTPATEQSPEPDMNLDKATETKA